MTFELDGENPPGVLSEVKNVDVHY